MDRAVTDKFQIEKGKITVIDPQDFDIFKTLHCGQVFRYRESGGVFEVFAKNQRAVLEKSENNVIINCSDEKFFVKYFDLYRNYDIIRLKLKDKSLFDAVIDFGQGIRILAQDPFETLVSFIISANNNISRIQKTVERLCSARGERCDGYFAFPSAEALAEQSVGFYEDCGLGYRAPYVLDTARAVRDGFDLKALETLPTEEAKKVLCGLLGVGPKVADCILLFGYNRFDVFPVDTWIRKVYNSYFGSEDSPKIIREELLKRFGNLSGFAQQYLFFYKRELDKNKKKAE